MLAYVFWHWPQPEIDPSAYEERVLDFHLGLRVRPPAGLRTTAVFRCRQLPWIDAATHVYEEWYLLRIYPKIAMSHRMLAQAS